MSMQVRSGDKGGKLWPVHHRHHRGGCRHLHLPDQFGTHAEHCEYLLLFHPHASKVSREVANLFRRKKTPTHMYTVSKICGSVCLLWTLIPNKESWRKWVTFWNGNHAIPLQRGLDIYSYIILDIEYGVEHLRLEHTNLTLSNIKWGTDLGTLVVLFDQTFHPLHKYHNEVKCC